MNKHLAPVAFALVALSSPRPADAVNLWRCNEPVRPTCANGYGQFTDQLYDSCRYEVEAYIAKVDAYLDCLHEAVSVEYERVLDEREKTISQFNCRADGTC